MLHDVSKINWFPGHMKKGIDLIKKNIKLIDLFIEVVDARDADNTSNPELLALFPNKPVIKIACKSDLSNVKTSELIAGNFSKQNKKLRDEILNKIESYFKQKNMNKKAKGLINPVNRIMIIGLPNVGKSSIINFIAGRHKVNVQNKPGVTRHTQWIKVTNTIQLWDSPGIMPKKISTIEEAYKLITLRIIKFEIINEYEYFKWFYDFITFKNYKSKIEKFYGIKETDNNIDMINQVAEKRGFLVKKNIFDLSKAIKLIWSDFSNGKICSFSF
jgi:ribosome biogenesis GTPase A